jgi:hypothetical protein
MTSLLMTNVSTCGLCIERCSRGTVLNRYVFSYFPLNCTSDQHLYQVSAHGEWPVIGAALGFPPVAGGDPGRPPRCGPVIAQRLQQLYNDVLRQFDQVYISSIVARLRSSQASSQLSPQPQAQPHQTTEADYQAPLASITSETSVMNTETMSILPRFSHTSGAELEAHHVPQNHAMPVSMNPAAMNGVRSSSIFTQSPSVSQIRCPTQEDLAGAKRWIEEKKRMAFNSG